MKSSLAMVSLCLGLTVPVFADSSGLSGLLSADFLNESMLPNSSALIDVHRQCQRYWTPILPPGTTTFTMSEGILAFDETGFKDAWFRKLAATDGGGYKKYVLTLAEDPVTHNLIVRNAKGVKVGGIPAPANYDPAWLAKTIYPDLFSGRYSSERVTAILAQYDPSRLVVQYTLLPSSDVDTYTAIVDAMALQQPETMMAMAAMDQSDPVTDITMGIGANDSTSAVVTISVPAGFTNHLDLFFTTNLLNARWTLAATGLLPVDGAATWTAIYPPMPTNNYGGGGGGGGIPPPGGGGGSSPSSNPCPTVVGFFAAGNGDLMVGGLTDPDGDGITTAREKFLYLSNPNLADTDGDGANDGTEVAAHTDPTNPDTTKPVPTLASPTPNSRLMWMP